MQALGEKDAVGRKFTGEMLAGGASERLPALGHVFALFAEGVSRALESFFAEKSIASVLDIARVTVFETLANGRGRFAALMSGTPGELQAVLIFDEHVCDFAVESCFSGGRDGVTEGGARSATTIDTFFVREYARRIADAFSAAFAQVVGSAVAFDALHVLSDTGLIGKRDRSAVAASLEVVCSGRASLLTALIPQSLLTVLRTELSAEPIAQDRSTIDPRWLNQLETGVSSARIPLVGVLETLEMSLREIADFSVGTVIDLSRPTAGRLRLECGGRGLFWGRLAQNADRYAIEIDGPIEDGAESNSDLGR